MMLGIHSTIIRGARRLVMNSKMGNKNYYKGRRCNPTGFLTRKGRFVVDPYRLVQYVVPDLTNFKLKPYVTVATNKPSEYAKPVTPQELLAGAEAAKAIFEIEQQEEERSTSILEEADRTSPAGLFSGLFFGKK
mmetsp:Transcript_133555/g.188720  ORF Transcript_133555/g.188720 Transcript_133555/m.188720 type:complete len:134 (+) Transcript_133555:106-507(+)